MSAALGKSARSGVSVKFSVPMLTGVPRLVTKRIPVS
jgi:hypothetical protein